jgi:hypothetical protein
MYDVVLLVEQELSEPDAKRVVDLHEDMPDEVKYHVLVPCHNAEAGVEASISALGTADLYGPGLATQREDLAEAQKAIDSEAKGCSGRSVQRLRDLGQTAEGGITHDRPIDALIATVEASQGQEVVILTRPHGVLPPGLDELGPPAPEGPGPAPARAGPAEGACLLVS